MFGRCGTALSRGAWSSHKRQPAEGAVRIRKLARKNTIGQTARLFEVEENIYHVAICVRAKQMAKFIVVDG